MALDGAGMTKVQGRTYIRYVQVKTPEDKKYCNDGHYCRIKFARLYPKFLPYQPAEDTDRPHGRQRTEAKNEHEPGAFERVTCSYGTCEGHVYHATGEETVQHTESKD